MALGTVILLNTACTQCQYLSCFALNFKIVVCENSFPQADVINVQLIILSGPIFCNSLISRHILFTHRGY